MKRNEQLFNVPNIVNSGVLINNSKTGAIVNKESINYCLVL
jgi:hypothetical protein